MLLSNTRMIRGNAVADKISGESADSFDRHLEKTPDHATAAEGITAANP